jgi:hypothetical protein
VRVSRGEMTFGAGVAALAVVVALLAGCTPRHTIQSMRQDLTPAQRVYAVRGEFNIALR